VGDHDNGSFVRHEIAQNLHDVGRVLRIESAGRFVGKDHQRIGDDGSGQRYPLLFATRHLHWAVIRPFAEADPIERSEGFVAAITGAYAAIQQCGFDVLLRGAVGDEGELLEDESNRAAPQG